MAQINQQHHGQKLKQNHRQNMLMNINSESEKSFNQSDQDQSRINQNQSQDISNSQISPKKGNISDLITKLKEFSPSRVKQQVSERYEQKVHNLKQELEEERNLRTQLENAIAELYKVNSDQRLVDTQRSFSIHDTQEQELTHVIQFQNQNLLQLKQENDVLMSDNLKMFSLMSSLDKLHSHFLTTFNIQGQSQTVNTTANTRDQQNRTSLGQGRPQSANNFGQKISSNHTSINYLQNPQQVNQSAIIERGNQQNISRVTHQQNKENTDQELSIKQQCDRLKQNFKTLYQNLKLQFKTQNVQSLQFQNSFEEQQSELDRLNEIVSLKENENQELADLYENQNLRIQELNQEIHNLQSYFDIERLQLRQNTQNQQEYNQRNQQLLQSKDIEIGNLREHIDQQETLNQELREQIDNMQQQMGQYQDSNQDHNIVIIKLQTDLNVCQQRLKDKEKELIDLRVQNQTMSETYQREKEKLERKVHKYSGKYKQQLKNLTSEVQVLTMNKQQQDAFIQQNQSQLGTLEKKYQQDIQLFRMENLRKDETVEQQKLKQRRFIEILQNKIRHLLYRSKELLIPVIMPQHANNLQGQYKINSQQQQEYDQIDQREHELQRGFNEVLELIERYLNPIYNANLNNSSANKQASTNGNNNSGYKSLTNFAIDTSIKKHNFYS
eukprot:403345284